MKKFVLFTMLLLSLVFVLAGCGLFQEVDAPSATLEAVPLELDEPQATAVPAETAADSTGYPADEETTASVDDGYPTDTTAVTAEGGLVVYAIVPGQSTVRFELDEDLRGERLTVVGTTDQIAGELAFDFNNLAATQVGEIRINARTLATDNNFRNRAINNEILDTGAHEFISFIPTSIDGLPSSAATGETVSFTITGDLTIRGITDVVTFDVTATAVAADQISGTASTTVMRADYGLQIPSVPSVANVEEEVELYIDFVANAK